MKEKVIKLLIKRGWNPEQALKITEANFEVALRCYPGSKASFIADFVASVD